MELIFYSADYNDFCSGLLGQIRALVPLENLVTCEDFSQLQEALLKPSYDIFAVVLVVSCPRELQDLCSIAGVLRSVSIVLILPDRQPETISKAHALRPRFLTWPDPDSREIIPVLHKMLSNVKKCQAMWSRELSTADEVEVYRPHAQT